VRSYFKNRKAKTEWNEDCAYYLYQCDIPMVEIEKVYRCFILIRHRKSVPVLLPSTPLACWSLTYSTTYRTPNSGD
jgi:hypothetical protein